jgi:protein required for attachment to host cells
MIVAPPRTLGTLRPRYNGALRTRLLGELNRDHTRDTVQRLQEALLAAEQPEG